MRDCVNPGDAAIILPIDENNNVVFIKQLRDFEKEIEYELKKIKE